MTDAVSLQQLQAHARQRSGAVGELVTVDFRCALPITAAALADVLHSLLVESDLRCPDGARAARVSCVDGPPPDRGGRAASLLEQAAARLEADGAAFCVAACDEGGTTRIAACCPSWLLDADGLSLAVHRSLLHLSPAAAAGPRPQPYPEYARWQRDLLALPESDFGRQYWTRRLAAVRPATELGLEERLRPSEPAAACLVAAPVAQSLQARLAAFTSRHQLAASSVALACWILALERLRRLQRTDLVVSLCGRGSDPAAAATLGRFAYDLPLSFPVEPGLPFIRFVQAVQEQCAEADEWKECFTEAHFAADLDGRSFRFSARELRAGPAWSESPSPAIHPSSQLEFAWFAGEGPQVAVAGDATVYGAPTMRFLLARWHDMLEAALRMPTALLGEMHPKPAMASLRSPAAPLSAAVLALQPPYELHPGRIALHAQGCCLTYANLQRAVAGSCLQWRQAGLRAGDVVLLSLSDPAAQVVASLAALSMGLCFLTPPARMLAAHRAAIVEEVHARALIDDAGLKALSPLPAGTGDPQELHPELPAYVMLTSGSSGAPRPVVVPRRALANQLAALARVLPLAAGTRVLGRTPASFDAWIWEFLHPLLCGARLELLGADAAFDEAAILGTIKREQVEVAQLTPSLLRACLRADHHRALLQLRHLVVGGEALPAELLEPFEGSGVTVVNAYGPTETCVNASLAFARTARFRRTVPLGTPLPGYVFHVLDGQLRPALAGEEGMLYIGGTGLALSAGDARSTAAAFLPDPFAAEAGARMYRTGDKVRLLPDGELEYLGRADRQIKVNGMRINAAAVVKALQEESGIREAAVFAPQGIVAGLVACVVPESANHLSVAALEIALRRKLPPWMCPASILAFDAFPLSAHGKLDLIALQELAGTRLAVRYVAPRTETERVIAQTCAGVLHRERIGVHDNFFLAGGHSLSFARLIVQLRGLFEVELPLEKVLSLSSVAALAEYVDEQLRAQRGAADG